MPFFLLFPPFSSNFLTDQFFSCKEYVQSCKLIFNCEVEEMQRQERFVLNKERVGLVFSSSVSYPKYDAV